MEICLTICLLSISSFLIGCKSNITNGNEVVVIADSIPLPSEVTEIVEYIINKDAQGVASKTVYPLERPYPIKTIMDSAQMIAYFPVIVDDSIVNVLRSAKRKDWSNLGWRGWTLDAGQYLWISDGLYEYPYLSKREKTLLKQLQKKDIGSLPEPLRSGWTPAYCFRGKSDKTLFRIDNNIAKGSYRLMVYPLGRHLKDTPNHIYEGTLETQGTEQNRVYEFFNDKGEGFELVRDDNGDGPTLTFTAKGRKPLDIAIEPAYWLDYSE